MNCKKCGSPLNENDQFCKNCGETVNSQTINNQQGMNNTQSQMDYPNNMNSIQSQANYQNNMNNVQQVGANYNNVPINNNQLMNKLNGNAKYIAIGLAIVGIAVIIIVGMAMNKSGNNSTNQQGTNNYKVAFNGFTFEVPDNLIYEKIDDSLLIQNEEGTWATRFDLMEGSFTQLKSRKSQLQAILQQDGITSSNVSEKNLNGVDFITLETSPGGQNAIIAMAKANSMYIISITAMNQDNEFDYKILENIAPIIKSAQYTGDATNNMAESVKIDMNVISELAK